ncbi:MAG: low molecular weight phosphotyrosine protein phosphatase [Bacteroidaceae bacterium]|nr:low molecular weight phosphotyrosine protein phosphatase [Bacteroidaceae bacterium]
MVKKLLFVCLGNICRSPAAHGIMQKMVDEAGLSSQIYIDSAGMGGWHVGNLPDPRMRKHAAWRNYDLTHRARQFKPEDFGKFDLIFVMDEENYHDVSRQAPSDEAMKKVHYLAEYLSAHPHDKVIPDPYYGGDQGFENVLDLLEDACQTLLSVIQEK